MAEIDSRMIDSLKSISRGLAIGVFLVGWLAIFGAVFNVAALTSILPGLVILRADAAVGLVLASVSLWLLQSDQDDRRSRRIAQFCAAAVILVGLFGLGEYLSVWDLRADQLLFHHTKAVEPAALHRTSFTVAVSFILTGFALLSMATRRLGDLRLAQVFAIVVAVPSLVALIGYAYSVQILYAHPFSAIAVHAALAFLALSVGALFARPNQGLMEMVTAGSAGGYLLRRLAPAVVVIPPSLGWLVLIGLRAGLYDSVVELSILAVLSILVFGLLLALSARSLHWTDISRRRAEFRKEYMEQYISLISHDLRAPLTVIQGQSQLLQRMQATAGGDNRGNQSAEAITIAARRMNAMIQDLVESARLESGQLQLQRQSLDLRAFATGLLERTKSALDTGRVQPEFSSRPLLVDADPDRLERILTNLLSNALKYSAAGSEVILAAREEGSMVVISVRDRGAGIDRADLPHLFERFYRANGTQHREGLGLGLYITRQLVEAHGGRIWAESVVGNGSTFHFTLPKARFDARSHSASPSGSPVAMLAKGPREDSKL